MPCSRECAWPVSLPSPSACNSISPETLVVAPHGLPDPPYQADWKVWQKLGVVMKGWQPEGGGLSLRAPGLTHPSPSGKSRAESSRSAEKLLPTVQLNGVSGEDPPISDTCLMLTPGQLKPLSPLSPKRQVILAHL